MLIHSLLLLFAVFQVQGRCPDGFFSVTESPLQCFKFHNVSRSWGSADDLCKEEVDEPQQLAKIDNPFAAVAVRKYIVESLGEKKVWTWLGARGTGAANGDGRVEWIQDNTTLSGNSAWYPRYPGEFTSKDLCLVLLTDEGNFKKWSAQPYYMANCYQPYKTLCELVPFEFLTTATPSPRRSPPPPPPAFDFQ